VFGKQMLWAHVILAAGCDVATHSHESEQIAFIISGKVRWRFGEAGSDEYQEVESGAGTVVELPSNYPHGLLVLEDAVILDVLSPPGEMGVDRQE
jgi:quercetin dioxygenase-like cupin family protein